MTIVEISKQKVINAIKKEPYLMPGNWVNDMGSCNRIVGDTKNCSVCAVGSVLRSVIDKNRPVREIDWAAITCIDYGSSYTSVDKQYLKERLEQLLKDEKYMNALSTLFETLWSSYREKSYAGCTGDISRHQIYRIRQKLVRFVKDNFPSKIQINIDGAKPAKDVKVIKK